jgi:thymidylate synthase ThyX
VSEILESTCAFRQNRRHKSPRALEHASFTFEVVCDYGIYRDLHRHRTLTQERQLLTCDLGYDIPKELLGTEYEADFRYAMKAAKNAYDQISEHFPEEAQYLVPMAYNIRFYFHVNLRALQWLTELRSQAQGHINYRFVAQEMAKQVSEAIPEFERFFKFVDYEGHELGRLSQEIRNAEKTKDRALNV